MGTCDTNTTPEHRTQAEKRGEVVSTRSHVTLNRLPNCTFVTSNFRGFRDCFSVAKTQCLPSKSFDQYAPCLIMFVLDKTGEEVNIFTLTVSEDGKKTRVSRLLNTRKMNTSNVNCSLTAYLTP